MGMLATRSSVRHLSAWTLGLVLAIAPAPAMADTEVFDDPVGDSTFVDISRVRVVHRDSVIVRVRSAVPLTAGQLYAFWIDAGNGRRPDYYVDFRANTGFDEVIRRVSFFGIVDLGSSSALDCVFAPTSLTTSRCRSESRDAAWGTLGASGSPCSSRTRT